MSGRDVAGAAVERAALFASPSIRVDDLGDGLALATIVRASRMNSMTPGFFSDLTSAVRAVTASGAEALVVTGEGSRAFCAGYDLAELGGLLGLTVPEFLDLEDAASAAIGGVHRLPVPVIAALNGAATGGGLALAIAADLRIAAEHAVLSCAFTRVGFSAGELGNSWALTRLVGPGFAAEMAFTGRLVTAGEALERGLVNRVVPGAELLDAAVALGRQVVAGRRGASEGVPEGALEGAAEGALRDDAAGADAAAGAVGGRPGQALAAGDRVPGARAVSKRRMLVAEELASYRSALASEVVEP